MRFITTRMVVVVMVVVVMVMVVNCQDTTNIPLQPATNNPAMDNWIDRLYQDKMLHYNKNARPVRDHTHNTTVVIGLSLKNIDVDDEKQEFLLNAWTIMTWQDESLTWVPTDYMNIDRVHFDDNDVWLPDIRVYNSAKGTEAHPFGPVPVLVSHQGQAFWFPPTHVSVRCNLDLTHWPRDQHVCMVRMGSWAHHGAQIDLQIQTDEHSGVMTDTLDENSRWKLVNVSATRALTNIEAHYPYVEVNFSFTIQRQARTQAVYITQSTLAVVVVVLATYLLPLQRFLSRLLMHLFSLGLLVSCFFTLFASLPATGGPVPLVVRYYSGSIVLTTLSMLATICLTTQACCCCGCSSSSSSWWGGSRLSKTLRTPYNHLENEVTMEEDVDENGQPRATQLNQTDASTSRYIRVQDNVDERGKVDAITSHQFLKIINYLLMALFLIAFVVDYVVLRNVML